MKSIYRTSLLVGIILLAVSLNLQSANVSMDGAIQEDEPKRLQQFATFSRPDPDGVPTKVYVGIYIQDVMEINDVGQTFEADFWAVVRWRDPRLAVEDSSGSPPIRTFTEEEIWWPYMYILNGRDLDKHYKSVFRVDAEGNIILGICTCLQ